MFRNIIFATAIKLNEDVVYWVVENLCKINFCENAELRGLTFSTCSRMSAIVGEKGDRGGDSSAG
jgi:hypothetical protein